MGSNFHLLGERNDIPLIMASLDMFTLSSLGEGFSNVIGEAMASRTPCVVTNVGDSAYIVGNSGVVVPPKKPKQLMKGWMKILTITNKKREELGKQARQRVVEKFDINNITQDYIKVYENLISETK